MENPNSSPEQFQVNSHSEGASFDPNNYPSPIQGNSPVFQRQETIVDTESGKSSNASSPIKSMSNSARTDGYFKEFQTNRLRKLKLFPVFGDQELAQISVNYWLYLEFFHMAIKLLFQMLLLFLILEVIDYYQSVRKIMDVNTIQTVYIGILWFALGLLPKLRVMEEKHIINNQALARFQWTEDLFCLLIEDLPIKTTREDIAMYFNSCLPLRITGGYVRKIILIKDFSEFAAIRKKFFEIEEKLIDPKLEDAAKEKLLLRKKALESKLSIEESKLIGSNKHAGKAIVAFNDIFARNLVYNQFRTSVIQSIKKSFWNFFNPNLYKRIISSTALPEPQDLAFENIGYSKIKGFLRGLLAYGGGSIFVLIISVCILAIQVWSQDSSTDKKGIPSFVISIVLITLNYIMGKFYTFINGFYKNISYSQIKMNYLNYSIYSAVVLYLVIQTISVVFSGKVNWNQQLVQTIALYSFKTIGKKLFSFFLISETCRKFIDGLKSEKIKALALKAVSGAQKVAHEFDFVGNVSLAIPLLAMCFAFMILNPILLISLTILVLYAIAICDRYRLIYYTDPFTLNSANFMLKVFKIYQWDHFCMFYGLIIFLISPKTGTSPLSEVRISPSTAQSFIYIYLALVYLFKTSSSLKNDFQKKFIRENTNVHYDSISMYFTSLFEKTELTNQIGVRYQNSAGF